jgi:hypothetical protein
MTQFQDRPVTVLNASHTDLQVDLVASLLTASVLPDSVVLADAMEKVSSIMVCIRLKMATCGSLMPRIFDTSCF